MPEKNQIAFNYKEVAEALIRQENIHEGIWSLYIVFGIQGANIGPTPGSELVPAAIVPVLKIGLQKADKESNLAVDAAIVNPPKSKT